MRILFMNSIKPHNWRGGEKWMVEMASGLAGRGHHVYLGVRPASVIADRARARDLGVLPIAYGPDVDPLNALRLRRFVKAHGIELICTNFDKELRLAAQAGLFTRRPVIVARKGLPYIFDRWYYRLTYRFWVDHIISPSRSIASKLRELTWLDRVAISVIPNGVGIDLPESAPSAPPVREEYGVGAETPLLGFVGDLCRQKGVDTLLRSLTGVGGEYHLLVIGDGGERRALERLTVDLHLGARVTFCGHRRDVASLYRQLDVVVCPSLFEGMPNVVLEAMGAGRAVVASAVDGVLEVIGGRDVGLLVPPGDERALSEAIAELLRDPSRRREMGEAARRWVSENFPLERTVSQVEDLFQRLIRGERCAGNA
jgi:glycosyltransferase involved in cell wall biosynthesis